MNILSLHHIAIICSDYENSKKFYTEILGFSILQETYREERGSYKLDLQRADTRLELFSFPSPPQRSTQPEATGLRHLAFAVKSVEQTVEELQSQGIVCEPIRIDDLTKKKFTFFNDPDNLPIEIYEQ